MNREDRQEASPDPWNTLSVLISFPFPWLLQAGKTWISRGCTQSCACVGGAVQCHNFTCPTGTQCQNSSCSKISKRAMGEGGRVCLWLKGSDRARKSLVPWLWRLGIRNPQYREIEGPLWTASLSVLLSQWLGSHIDLVDTFFCFLFRAGIQPMPSKWLLND